MRPRSWRRLPSLSLRPERGAENVVSTGIIAPFPAAASRNGLGNSAGAWGSPYRESVPGQRRSTRNACPNVSSSLDSRRNRCSAEAFRDVSFDSGRKCSNSRGAQSITLMASAHFSEVCRKGQQKTASRQPFLVTSCVGLTVDRRLEHRPAQPASGDAVPA